MKRMPATIEGEGLTLELLTQRDAEALFTLTNDPAIATIISFLSYPVDRAVTDDWITLNDGDQDRVYGVFSPDGTLTGQIGAHLTEDGSVEIGYWIGSAFMGRGLASRCVKALASTLSQSMPEAAVFAECLPENLPSRRVLEKGGFVCTGLPGSRSGREIYRLTLS